MILCGSVYISSSSSSVAEMQGAHSPWGSFCCWCSVGCQCGWSRGIFFATVLWGLWASDQCIRFGVFSIGLFSVGWFHAWALAWGLQFAVSNSRYFGVVVFPCIHRGH